uniref:Uncharacterized protein n=1 Tax=Mesocestoides corti TaxID=53468 RepID=A0A5K3FWE6_MESCO
MSAMHILGAPEKTLMLLPDHQLLSIRCMWSPVLGRDVAESSIRHSSERIAEPTSTSRSTMLVEVTASCM